MDPGVRSGREDGGRVSRNLGSELRVIQVAPLPNSYASPESLVIDPRYRDKVRSRTKEEVDANLEREVGRLREVGGEVAGAHAAVRTQRSCATPRNWPRA
jgi:hypothetical protein